MPKVSIVHTGSRMLAVPVPGGTITVKPGAKIASVDILSISDAQHEIYKQRGLSFTEKGAKKDKERASPPSEDIAQLEKAVEVARQKHAVALAAAEKETAGDAERKALNDAIDALEDAEDALDEARS
ncbi:MAG: hypothetical protein QHC90_25885 [Shinella sp.]|nr:hypothetical protein [Shinella sp.]